MAEPTTATSHETAPLDPPPADRSEWASGALPWLLVLLGVGLLLALFIFLALIAARAS